MTPAERAAMEAAEKALEQMVIAFTASAPAGSRDPVIANAIATLTALRSCLSSAGDTAIDYHERHQVLEMAASTVTLPRDYVEGLIVTLEISSQPVEAQKLREMLGKEVMPSDEAIAAISRPDTSPRSQCDTGGGAFERGARAMREDMAQFCRNKITVRGVGGARMMPYWQECLGALMSLPLPKEPTP